MAQVATLEVPSGKKTDRISAKVLTVGLAALFVCAGATGWAVYSHGYEATDDAQVDGHLNVVSSRIGGTVESVYVTDNQIVEAGRPLVDLDASEQKMAASHGTH